MRQIPDKIRRELAADPFMLTCIHQQYRMGAFECDGPIEWHHPFIYARKQIVDAWATVPVCNSHHSVCFHKEFAEFIALTRATEKDLEKYPKYDWFTRWSYLTEKFHSLLGARCPLTGPFVSQSTTL